MSMILSILLVVVVFTLMMPDTSLCSRRPLNVVAFGDTGFDLARELLRVFSFPIIRLL